MRIAVLTNAYPPESRGGAGRIAEAQVHLLETAGHEVRVWRPDVFWFSASPWVRLRRHFGDLVSQSSCVREINAWQPDVLLTHNLTGCGFATPKQIQKRGVRWIHTLHDVQLFDPSGRVVDAKRVTLWQIGWAMLRQPALGHPNVVISPTAWLMRRHRRRGFFLHNRTRCEIVPNPGPTREHHAHAVHHPLRLLFVGRVHPDKGSVLLAQLIKQLHQPFTMEIIGSGPDSEMLRNLSPCVHLMGELDQQCVHERMMVNDILLVPSCIEENQPTVIVEAAAVGLPVIASHKGGIIETLGRAGITCSPTNPPAWLEAIEILSDPGMYARHVARMEEMSSHHDPMVYRTRLLSLLKSKW